MNNRYTVIWRRQLIEQKLAEYVVATIGRGEDTNAITAAMNTIDQLLAGNPETRGESRGPLERVLIVPPLTVTFEIHEEEHIVYILTLQYRPRSKPAS